MQPQFVTDLQTRINDSMDNIRAVKGEKFADATHCLFRGAHMASNLNLMLGRSDIDPDLRSKVLDQVNTTLSAHMNLIVNLSNLADSDVNEMMSWVDVMFRHVRTAIEEAS